MARVFMQRVTWRLVALVGLETLLIVGAVTLAAYVRLGVGNVTQADSFKALLIAFVCQLCLYYAELYDFAVLADRRHLVVRLLQAFGSTSLILAVLYYWFPALVIGRGVFVLSSALVVAAVGGWRIVFEWLAGRIGSTERLLLVGTSAAAVSLAKELYERKELGVQIVGFIDPDPARLGAAVLNPGVIGALADIPDIIREHSVDRVVVSLADARGRLPMDKLLEMKLDGVTFDHLASVYEEYTGKIAVENLRPSWLIFSEGFRKSPVLKTAKRAVDIGGALIGFACFLPAMAAVALAIRSTSAGDVLFKQARVGRNGRLFTLYKFRSMFQGAEALTGAVWATENDKRITPVGRFLRRTRLDELPQLWNVLRGDMSLVGPRPERPEFVQKLAAEIPFYGQRHVVKPGLTGWAQVRYAYGASIEDTLEKLQYDLFYIKNMSMGLDVFIIFKTLQTVLLQRGT